MKRIIYLLICISLLTLIFGTYLIKSDYTSNFSKKIKDNTPESIKKILKNTLLYIPYSKREIKNLNQTINELSEKNNILTLENYKNKNIIENGKFKHENFDSIDYNFNSVVLPFFNEENLFGNKKSGYIENYKDKIVIVFTSGKIIFLDKKLFLEDKILEYKVIENNIEDNFFDQKIKWTGIKDIKLDGKNLYLSITKKVKQNCYNTSLYKTALDEIILNFKKVFEPKECFSLDRYIKAFKYFNGYQNGGRITSDKNNIYLTIGDYNYWEEPQSIKSFAGKIISIDKNNNKVEIISLGHRNQQGLQFLENQNLLISTEHGPKGGDEINLINLNDKKPLNFGWPIASYGEHYDVVPINSYTKKFAPLLKSHSKYGFEEPIKYFEKSIGISEIIKNYQKPNRFFITSLKDKKIYEIQFKNNSEFKKIVSEIEINERIRDIIYDFKNHCYYIYGESTPKLISMCKK